MQVDSLEHLKLYLRHSNFDYVSFDIFDTLILRPFFHPTDLFILNAVENNLKNKKKFKKIRILCERIARFLSVKEDIHIDDIYRYMRLFYKQDLLFKLKNSEINLEETLGYSRKTAKILFNFSKEIGKKIICISDMYLDKNTILTILDNNGYTDIYEIYVSSSLGYTKSTGNLYKYVLNDLKTVPEKIIHIGDNYNSDVINSKKYGIESVFFERTMDLESKNNAIKYNIDIYEILKKSVYINSKYDNPFKNNN